MYIRHAKRFMVLVGLVAAAPALAQQTGVSKTNPAITLEAARKVALAKVPGGKVEHEELEQEHGQQVYSFEISAPGQSQTKEVLVNADNGQVVSVSPEEERHGKGEGEHDDDREENGGGRESSIHR